MIIKAYSIRQPYATLIARGLKTIETRVWKTPYRGVVLICSAAGKAIPSETFRQDLVDTDKDTFPKGMALAIADLVDCRDMTEADELKACCSIYPKAKAHVLSNIRQLATPFPVKGALYLFDVDTSPYPLNLV